MAKRKQRKRRWRWEIRNIRDGMVQAKPLDGRLYIGVDNPVIFVATLKHSLGAKWLPLPPRPYRVSYTTPDICDGHLFPKLHERRVYAAPPRRKK